MSLQLVTLAVAVASSAALTPMVCWLAVRIGLVDRPDPDRKLHRRETPLGGGVAIFLAAVGAVVAVAVFGQLPLDEGLNLWALLAAAGVLLLIGLVDDFHGLRGRQKVAGQLVAVGILIASGLVIREVEVFEWQAKLELLAIPFTAFWLLGAINALNLLDGADGFASTIGIVICGTMAVLAAMNDHASASLVAVAMTGALLGFLVYNFPPASIFLGDAGSMLIGLVAGVLGIASSLKGAATVALAAPLAVLAIPIFDSFMALLRRWLTGRSIYQTDRGHLHHTMLSHGLGPWGLIAGIASLSALTAGGALISVMIKNEAAALASAGAVVGILVVSRVFGFSELTLAAQKALAFGNSLVAPRNGGRSRVRQQSTRLQGSRNWDELWSALTDFAELHELDRVCLDLNLSWLHEGYHAVWDRDNEVQVAEQWLARIPLRAEGRVVGRLELSGSASQDREHELLVLISELLESLQSCVQRLSNEVPPDLGMPSQPLTATELPEEDGFTAYDPTRESV